ncbi:uncharacterized protein LOC112081594 [Eutrema salsugineum]|uniref:uncharacterized protein LOC112081594 n=1 Tax=Eutrema salsugineum TaxID=72664 RepID=UPI000CED61A7|nr:uncharacterized protein LOC112081594 [Eutrema salsugineum]
MVRRMKPLMPGLISESQSAFVKGRLISDNILIAHEMLHALKTRDSCSKHFMAIKTDMTKAYDRLEWPFLRKALLALAVWKDQAFSRDQAGRPHVTLYLFIMCSEILVQLLQQAESQKGITGLKVAAASPAITHLLFADDSLFFCRANNDEADHLLDIINAYCVASGQSVNQDKSTIVFGKKLPTDRKLSLKIRLRIPNDGGGGLYLGLHESFSGSRVAILRSLTEKLSLRVNGWRSKFLSQAGKEVMLKAVAMAMPTFTMSCFRIPKTVCAEMISIMARFWWQKNEETRGIHWAAWPKISIPKKEGGLGFRDIECFNTALLGKQLWRMLLHPDSLLAQVFRGRYFKDSSPLFAKLGSRPSYAWRSLFSAQAILREGCESRGSRGEHSAMGRPPRSALPLVNNNLVLNDLLLQAGRGWDLNKVAIAIHPEDVQLVTSVSLGSASSDDTDSDRDLLLLVPWILWRLWKARNSLLFSSVDEPATQSLLRAREDLENWKAGLAYEDDTLCEANPTPQLTLNIDLLTGQGWTLCSVDGSWEASRLSCGLGWIILVGGEAGARLGSMAIPNVPSALFTEAEAFRWAVQCLSQTPHRKVHIFSDCKDVISALHDPAAWPSLAPLVYEILDLGQRFEEFEFSYRPRRSNQVADVLARAANQLQTYIPSLDFVIPSWLQLFIQADLQNSVLSI